MNSKKWTVLSALMLAFVAFAGGEKQGLFKEHLNGPLEDVDEIIFTVRGMGRDYHYYCNFGRLLPSQVKSWWHKYGHRQVAGDPWRYGLGHSKLCRMDLRTGEIKVLLEDPEGGIRDPNVYYDGKKILFSYRKGGEHRHHLYEINIDGTGLRQLTDGDHDDIEPIYLPNDDLLFVSTRSDRVVPCNNVEVALTYRCDKDGKNLRLLSTNTENETTPWMLPDGRVVLTRWEYQERSATRFHHLWTMNPDGTRLAAFYGNGSTFGSDAMCDAKPIPGTTKVIMANYGFHGRPEHMGYIQVVDPENGPDDKSAMKTISPPAPDPPEGCFTKKKDIEGYEKMSPHRKAYWRDPYPIDQKSILVACWKGLYVMDYDGNYEKFYELPEGTPGDLMVHEPRPLRPRQRERIQIDRVNYDKTVGTMVLQNAAFGRNMGDIKPTDVKKLLIVEAMSRPVSYIGVEAVTEGGGFFTTRILGEVPVEKDGSAHFEVPAGRSFYFVLLDENDRSLKRMQSLTNVMPGEYVSCLGCHEERKVVPQSISPTLLALKRPAGQPKIPQGVPEKLDFNRHIQPIFDKHCIGCHNNEKFAGRLVLTGAVFHNRAQSLRALNARKFIVDKIKGVKDNYTSVGNLSPRAIGSSASQLIRTISKPHHGVKLSDTEKDILRLWIDTGAVNVGTYAVIGARSGYRDPTGKVKGIVKNRCAECHFKKKKGGFDPQLVDLAKPEMSVLLRAPLAKSAGGLGLCEQRKVWEDSKAEPAVVFKDASDPDYVKILDEIRKSAKSYEPGKDWYGPDFKPNDDYIWCMKKYGVLPKDWKFDGKTDWYELDEQYYRHLYRKYGMKSDPVVGKK